MRWLIIVLFFAAITACNSGSGSSNTSSSSSSSTSSSSSSSSSSGSSGDLTCGDNEAREIFSSNNCLVCHNAQSFTNIGGGLNLDTGDVGQRMLNRATAFGGTACSNEMLIDADNFENSLLLKLTNPTLLDNLTNTGCSRQAMPPSGSSLSDNDHQCLTQWVEHIVATKTPDEQYSAPFEPAIAPQVLSKSKYLLSGLAPTETELTALGGAEATPNNNDLKTLITTWEQTPQYEAKIRDFLSVTLQQVTDDRTQYVDQLNNIFNRDRVIDSPALVDNLNQMFLHTAWDIVNNEQDFRQVVTTRQWKVTTAVLVTLIYLEKENQTENRSYQRNPKVEDRLRAFAHLTEEDYSDWRTVTLSQGSTPYEYENTASFASKVRAISEGDSIALLFPRVGFFSTPSFYELWPTNDDNDFRVTTQQTLIAALDKIFDPSDGTAHFSDEAIPPSHIDPDTTCYNCHRLMDPMRLVFSNFQVSRNRAKQSITTMQPAFVLDGVRQNVDTVDEFAQQLVSHPGFASAWVQKLCMWANSQRCDALDPEFQRLASAFETQNFNLKLLIREFFSSPISTATQKIQTHESRTFFVSMIRANHFCAALDARVKTLNEINTTTGSIKACKDDNFGIIQPDKFIRGDADLIQTTQLAAFDSKSIDRICAQVATSVFQRGTNRVINVDDGVVPAIEQLVTIIMGLPNNHPRHATAKNQLQRIYDISFHRTPCEAAINPTTQNTVACGYGNNTTPSLRAAWFAACTSPDAISIGL